MIAKIYIILLIVILCSMGCKTDSMIQLTDLKCENLVNPNAIDNIQPHFSWKTIYANGPITQTSYEIQVASDSVALIRGKADMWNSGEQASAESVMIPYAGKELKSRDLCYWRVRVGSDKGEMSDWSSVARFGIGLLDKMDIHGEFIALPSAAGDIRNPILRKKITLDDTHTSFLHVNSLGYHEVYVNGAKVNDDVLSPAVSQLDKRSLIVTYDVTHLLRKGENEVVVWLGQGWYKPTTYGRLGLVHDGPVVRAQMDVLKDGAWETVVVTDSTWTGYRGGYTDTGTWRALQFGGEMVDARLNPTDMTASTLDRLTSYSAQVVAVPEHEATPQMCEGNRITETISLAEIKKLSDKVFFVDMGKCLNGWFELRLPELPAGDSITLEYSDFLDKDGNMMDQGQKDSYIASGGKGEVFRNRFNHHAFRYVKISNLPTQPKQSDIKAYLIHTNYSSASSFECSDADLNAIHDMIQYTFKCLAFSGYMVDCPHLERGGYGGDGNSSSETFFTMYDGAPLYANWLQAWGDMMHEGGSLPHVAPTHGADGGGPYWCGFIVMAPWQTYLNYGDARLIQRYYSTMKEWLKYVDRYTVNGLLKPWPNTDYRGWYLGDWLAPDGVDSGAESSVTLVNNCFISDCYAKMERMANLVGKPEDAAQYAERRKVLNELIYKTFYDPVTGNYATGSQLDMTYPMLVGVTPPDQMPKATQQLFANTESDFNGHIAVGLVGVPILTKWAIQNRATDFMYSMLKKRDYPSYLHMIDNGATTTWEYWHAERSRIHNCYNGIGTWFYQAVGGLRPNENEVGYKHIFIDPQIPQGVTWAKTTKESPYGTIKVDWVLASGELTINVTLPIGTTATVVVPASATACKIDAKTHIDLKQEIIIGNGSHSIIFIL